MADELERVERLAELHAEDEVAAARGEKRTDVAEVWAATLDRIRASVAESTFSLWIEPLEAVCAVDGVVYLSGPDSVRAWSERRYSSLIAEALREVEPILARVSFATPGCVS